MLVTADQWRGDCLSALGYSSLRMLHINLAVLRDEAFKYVHFAGLPPLLFDLADDPGETRDRSRDPAYAAVRLDFAERLLSLRAAHLDQTLAGTMLTAAGPVTRRITP